ncbi:UPF0016-domain-containing protein [Zopfochytrium polystomum]|nr:UPF0016-domain-containing protein [Zopfochytrium polystomum]
MAAHAAAADTFKTLVAAPIPSLGRAAASPSSSTLDAAAVHSLWVSFLVILVSEIGDKTFIIAAVMAMRHSRTLIFSAAISALAFMTVLSALLGHIVPALFSKTWTQFAASALFVVFGIKMVYEGLNMTGNESKQELEEVTQELLTKPEEEKVVDGMEKGGRAIGDAPLSPTSAAAAADAAGAKGFLSPKSWYNLASLLLSPVFVQTFVLTMLAEWGDRSQIATIALASADDLLRVTVGSLLGHILCTGLAVLGGRLLAAWISVRTVTLIGAVLFVGFGVVGLYQWSYGIDD